VSDTVEVVTAAGSGERLGAGIPKAYVELGGCTMLERAVDGLLASGVVDRVVVAVPADRVDETKLLLGDRATVVAGGSERPETVRHALAAVGDPEPYVRTFGRELFGAGEPRAMNMRIPLQTQC